MKMKKIILLFALAVMMVSSQVQAQCAMCKRVAETDAESKQKQSAGRSLNHGILYMLSIPYLIGAVGAIAWYTNRKKNKDGDTPDGTAQ